jgi:hypothetical protein
MNSNFFGSLTKSESGNLVYRKDFTSSWFFLFTLFLTCLFSGCKREEFSIRHCELLSKIDTSHFEGIKKNTKIDVYLVSGYRKRKDIEKKIDNFVCENKDPHLENYKHYLMYFFRKTKITNEKYLADNPRDYYRHSMVYDRLFEYRYRYYKNGEMGVFSKKKYNCKEYPVVRTPRFKCE